MTIKINNTITLIEYVNKVNSRKDELKAGKLLRDFYECIRANMNFDRDTVEDLWEDPRGIVVACSGESETVKQLTKQHLRYNGWDAHIVPAYKITPRTLDMLPDTTHVVVRRPKGV
jgi:hypothetical protein